MTTSSLSHPEIVVEHLSTDRITRLFTLLAYAKSHSHSAAWIPTILTILAQQEGGNAR
jgi:hypothetical protein